MQVPIGTLRIKEGRRKLDAGHVRELADSIRELGLLNPVTIDKENIIIAGLHRLEAVKQLGWTEVECMVSSLEGLWMELAEIDENIIRSDLSSLEYGDVLLRRKEIYETLHPETRNGGDRRSGKNRSAKCTSETVRSFVEDTAEKLGVNPCTVRRQIQTAKNLSPEAKEIIRESDTKLSRKEALKLSRLEAGQQKEAAALLAAKDIRNVEEYTAMAGKRENVVQAVGKQEEGQAGMEEAAVRPVPDSVMPAAAKESSDVSLKEIIADLKDPDKDCGGTPDSFLQEFNAFVRKFRREIGWYGNPYYDAVYPFLTDGQIKELRGMAASLCSVVEEFLKRVEAAKQKGQ